MVELDISLLIPLVLLVVAALANVSRQVDMIEIANETHDDVYLLNAGPFERVLRPLFELSLSPGEKAATLEDDDLSGDEPKLGRFNHIHAFNSLLIAIALVLTVLAEGSISGAILAGVVGVFWMVLPIIEIDEYDLMMRYFEPGDPLYSLSLHMACTGLLAVPAVALAAVDVAPYANWLKAAAAIGYLIAAVLVGNLFQSYLDDELETLRRRGVRHSDG